MTVTHKITLDLVRKGIAPLLDAVRGDSARTLEITLITAGESWPIPENATATVRFRRSDGYTRTYSTVNGATAFTVAGNKLTIVLDPDLFGAAGFSIMQVTLVAGGAQVTTFDIYIRVAEGADTVTSGGSMVKMTELVAQVNGVYNPPAGYSGFNRVVVNTSSSVVAKTGTQLVAMRDTGSLTKDSFYLVTEDSADGSMTAGEIYRAVSTSTLTFEATMELLDTTTATAEETDVVKGKTYFANDEEKTGTLQLIGEGENYEAAMAEFAAEEEKVTVKAAAEERVALEKGANMVLEITKEQLQEIAEAAKILKKVITVSSEADLPAEAEDGTIAIVGV